MAPGKIMADRLNGYRILILETREEAQFSRLLTEQGADVVQCPMFAIHDAPDYGFDVALARHDWGLIRRKRCVGHGLQAT